MCLNENTAYMPSVNAIQIKSSAMNESIRMNEWSDYATSAKMKRNLAFSLFLLLSEKSEFHHCFWLCNKESNIG